MIDVALALLMRPADAEKIDAVRQQWRGPYRAMSALKGDEEIGASEWPWVVVGTQNINCFGRLWPKAYALAVAAQLNEVT